MRKIIVTTPVSHLPGAIELLETKGNIILEETINKKDLRKILLEKSLNDLLLEKPVDVSPISSADPVLKNSADSASTSQVRQKIDSTADQIELNNVEQNVVNKNSSDVDVEINNLQVRLNAIKENQKSRQIEIEDDAEIKLTKEELDTVNERADELDEIIKDGVNCVNGR